tara:strand:+ start:943 stop:1092 length:150 start_codon:yes stop_codon:yes gene_type:complete
MLKINNLNAKIQEKSILSGFNLEIKPGEVHAIMGPQWIRKEYIVKYSIR